MSCQISFEMLKAQLGIKVERSPVTGNPRIAWNFNDIHHAVELLGGTDKAAMELNVQPERVETWIEDYYVPDKQAMTLSNLTKIRMQDLQRPNCYYFDKTTDQFWPPTGFVTRRENEWIDLDEIEEYNQMHAPA